MAPVSFLSMPERYNRRAFIGASLAMTSTFAMPSRGEHAVPLRAQEQLNAIAFDAFTLFDPRPVEALAEQLFRGNGTQLVAAWRTRQFEYTWLRTLTRTYVDFWHVTEDALRFAAESLKLDLTPTRCNRLMQAWLDIKTWSDVLPALASMKQQGLRLAILANPTTAMLNAWIANSQLDGVFEPHLSTDRVRAFKPDPRAYQMGVDAFATDRRNILFAAFGNWDVAGAKAFGYPVFWVNRAGAPAEELGFSADGIGNTLTDLASFVAGRRGTLAQ
ncbi:MAG: haloacid dehalogenase type II [Paraburkholderia sp.]|jgi:2-haloacid dehalogenase|uniref:haloacid dehalogenase type II n=2 Tax=Burkholderiales TaxID=80840 RepID=UPI001BB11D2A|nr:haloacid dehalogenase type II [Burkholderia sp. 4M9327F10]